MSKGSENWASKLVELFGRPLAQPFSQLTGMLEDYLRVVRYKNRVKMLKDLEEGGLINSEEGKPSQLIFRPTGDQGREGGTDG